MYVCGLVIPVPGERMEDYCRWAENSAALFRDYGCREIVECWEDFVPDGTDTDFRRAVAAKPGEKIVFVWQVWPSKEELEAAESAMHADPRMEAGEPPFDARRLILGCFQPIFTMGRAVRAPAPDRGGRLRPRPPPGSGG